jgi:lysophospholipase L1-like esterase
VAESSPLLSEVLGRAKTRLLRYSRSRRKRAGLLVLALFLLADGSAAADSSRVGYPSSMAATGDSITRAFNTGFLPFTNARWNSWSTGAFRSWSHYRRILGANLGILGRNANDARTGAKAADLERQAGLAVAQGAQYVTILIGANDACASSEAAMTPVREFRARVARAIRRLSLGLPSARLYVVSIPNLYRLWLLFHHEARARFAWRLTGFCKSMLAHPLSTEREDEARRRRVRRRVIGYNHQLAAVCALYIHCRFDGNAVFRHPFRREHVSKRDYFHPSLAGQRALAAVTWAAGYDFTDRVAPVSAAAATRRDGVTWVALSASDDRGVRGIEYRLEVGSYRRYAGPFAAPGGVAITYRAVDVNGNVEASHTLTP